MIVEYICYGPLPRLRDVALVLHDDGTVTWAKYDGTVVLDSEGNFVPNIESEES